MPHPRLLAAALLAALPLIARAHDATEAAHDMATAAQSWLASLTVEQRAAATFELGADERENWHYVPKDRQGLPFAKMDDRQRQLARALLAAGLSQHGVAQAEAVIALERVLRAMGGGAHRDELLYYFSIFGEPAVGHAWGWRIEGHHLSVNFTIAADGRIAATPNFVGSNPAEVRIEHPQKGRRALAAEEDLGRAFVLSLDDAQRRQAILEGSAPGDILTAADRIAKPPTVAGLGFASLTPEQQARFKALVELYATRLREEIARQELKKIEVAGWDRLRFAWIGSTEPGQPHYYRIQSPDFVIEYDNTQNGANHIHTVWRVFEGDFGRDLLREHYRNSHSH